MDLILGRKKMRDNNPAIIFLCLLAMACNKPLPDYSNQPFAYTVTGIKDISIPANDYTDLTASINIIAGFAQNEPVTVTFKGMPANVYIQENGTSFLLNHELVDSIGARNAIQGTYPMQAVFSNKSAGSQTYNFNLTITPPINRVAEVAGYYYPSSSCGENIYVSCQIDSLSHTSDSIMIIDRTSKSNSSYGTFDTSYGIVDCCTNTFIIPLQNVQGMMVSGNGLFSGSTVLLSRTFTTDSSSYPCIVTLGQQ